MELCDTVWKMAEQSLRMFNMTFPYAEILLLDIHAKEIKAQVLMFIATSFRGALKWKTPKCPLAECRMWYVYTAGLLTHRKREIVPSDGTGVDLDNKPVVRLHCVKCPG